MQYGCLAFLSNPAACGTPWSPSSAAFVVGSAVAFRVFERSYCMSIGIAAAGACKRFGCVGSGSDYVADQSVIALRELQIQVRFSRRYWRWETVHVLGAEQHSCPFRGPGMLTW
jgi:hypothetical protein